MSSDQRRHMKQLNRKYEAEGQRARELIIIRHSIAEDYRRRELIRLFEENPLELFYHDSFSGQPAWLKKKGVT